MNLTEIRDRTRSVARFRHLSYKTEKSYLGWIERYARWCKQHQDGDHGKKLNLFLTYLAKDRNVSVAGAEFVGVPVPPGDGHRHRRYR
jgi:hypothetical protein